MKGFKTQANRGAYWWCLIFHSHRGFRVGAENDICFVALRRRRWPISAQGKTLGKISLLVPNPARVDHYFLAVSIGSPGCYPGLKLANAFGVRENVDRAEATV
jgi:hypothetical protein